MYNKYIIFKSLNTPILFPETLSHADIASKIGLEPISAGFWVVTPSSNGSGVKYEAFGESFTLGLKSREEDTEILNRYFNPYR